MSQGDNQTHTITLKNSEFIPHIIKLLEEGHTVKLMLRGVSMRPFLEDRRDVGLLTKVTRIKVGKPVLAETRPGHFVLHRIVKVVGNQVILRGDGNLACEVCTINDIRANVIGFYRKGRTKLDRIDGWKWRAYSWIWTRLLPVRRYLLSIIKGVKGVKGDEDNA